MKTILFLCFLFVSAANISATPERQDVIARLIENERILRDLNESQQVDLQISGEQLAAAQAETAKVQATGDALKKSEAAAIEGQALALERATAAEAKLKVLEAFKAQMNHGFGWGAIWYGLQLMGKWILGFLLGMGAILTVLSFLAPPVGAFLSMFFTNLFSLYKRRL